MNAHIGKIFMPNQWYRTTIKRILDISLSLIALIVLGPVLLITSIFVLLKLGWPIIFCQKRPGLNAQTFTLYKFRTMRDAYDADGNLLPDADRLTVFGRFLRSTSLDELPELINVILGNMSLVGPRPLLIDYLSFYTLEQARRHEVKPGITGWAQVNGRNAISWEDKFKLDIYYVDNVSLSLDIKIIFLTVWKMISREGISAEAHPTMPRFTGTSKQ
jgi:sugar transferase EpsL